MPSVASGMSSASEQCWGASNATYFDWTINVMSLLNTSSRFVAGNWTQQLTLEKPWFEADQNMGQHTFSCNNLGQPFQWMYWGTQVASGNTYHFSFVNSTYWNLGDLGLDAQGYMGFAG